MPASSALIIGESDPVASTFSHHHSTSFDFGGVYSFGHTLITKVCVGVAHTIHSLLAPPLVPDFARRFFFHVT